MKLTSVSKQFDPLADHQLWHWFLSLHNNKLTMNRLQ